MEAGRGAFVAPGVARQRLVNAEPRWGPADGAAGNAAENLSQGQLRPSQLRAPGPRTPQAPPPAPDQAAPGAWGSAACALILRRMCASVPPDVEGAVRMLGFWHLSSTLLSCTLQLVRRNRVGHQASTEGTH